MINAFLKHGHFLRELNKTNITLIPKKRQPGRICYCRPINLCNA